MLSSRCGRCSRLSALADPNKKYHLLVPEEVLTQRPVSPTFHLSCQTGTVLMEQTADMFVHDGKGTNRAQEVRAGRDYRTSVKPQLSRGQVPWKSVL